MSFPMCGRLTLLDLPFRFRFIEHLTVKTRKRKFADIAALESRSMIRHSLLWPSRTKTFNESLVVQAFQVSVDVREQCARYFHGDNRIVLRSEPWFWCIEKVIMDDHEGTLLNHICGLLFNISPIDFVLRTSAQKALKKRENLGISVIHVEIGRSMWT